MPDGFWGNLFFWSGVVIWGVFMAALLLGGYFTITSWLEMMHEDKKLREGLKLDILNGDVKKHEADTNPIDEGPTYAGK